eukprot:6779105-Pyramimonas_sp.AAC.1
MSHFRLKVYAAARAAHCAARAHVDRLIRGTLAACRQAPGQDGGACEPLIFIRQRKYDGTRMKVTCRVEHEYTDDVITEASTGTREIFVTKAGFAMIFRKRSHGSEHHLLVGGSVPTHLSVLEGSKGDVINAALRHQLDSPLDPLIETRFPRQLDVVGCDAASGNLRSERAMGYQYPFRSQLLLLCRAHMKKKVAEQ